MTMVGTARPSRPPQGLQNVRLVWTVTVAAFVTTNENFTYWPHVGQSWPGGADGGLLGSTDQQMPTNRWWPVDAA